MTVQEMIKRYDISYIESGEKAGCIAPRNTTALKADNAIEMLRDNKPEIIKTLIANTEAAKTAAKERDNKIAAIEGLTEIKTARREMSEYHRQFNAMMDDENNDGARAPKMPTTDLQALESQYPRAAAYLKAEGWSDASHDVKSGAGRKAVESIINGNDYNDAIATMEYEFSDYCEKHIFD